MTGVCMRELRDVVPAAELGRVLAQFARRLLDEALDHEGGLGPSRAAIGIDRRRVRVDRRRPRNRSPECRTGPTGAARRDRSARRTRRSRDRRRDWPWCGPEAKDLAVLVGRHLRVGDVIAAMRVGQEGFDAVGGPLHRALDLLRRPDADRLFRIDEDLGAEAAADIRRDDAQLVLRRDADEGREHEAGHVRVLARRVERVVVGCRNRIRRPPRAARWRSAPAGC